MNITQDEAKLTMYALRYHANGLDRERRSRKMAGPAYKPSRDLLKEQAAELRVLAHRVEAEGVGTIPRVSPLATLTRNLLGDTMPVERSVEEGAARARPAPPQVAPPHARCLPSTPYTRGDAADIARGYSGLS